MPLPQLEGDNNSSVKLNSELESVINEQFDADAVDYRTDGDLNQKFTPGELGLDRLEDYEGYVDLNEINIFNQDVNKIRAENQSGFEQGFHAVAGGLAKGLFTAAEDLSYLADFESHINVMKGVDDWEKNAVAEWALEMKGDIDDALPIYRESPGEVFDFSDPGFYWGAMSGIIDSAVGFGIPGGMVAKGVSAMTRATKAAKLAAAIAKSDKGVDMLNAFGSSVVSTWAEGTMMGHETFESTKESLIDSRERGDHSLTDEEIDTAAGDAADEMRFSNMAMIGTNAFALHGLSRGKGVFGTKAFDGSMKNRFKHLGESLYKPNSDNLILQGLTEAGEEMLQGGFQKEAQYAAEKKAGAKVEDMSDNYLSRMLDFSTREESVLEGMMGFFGGGPQRIMSEVTSGRHTKAGKQANKERMEAQEQVMAANSEYMEDSSKIYKAKSDIAADLRSRGKEDLANAADETTMSDRAIANLENGTQDEYEKYLKGIVEEGGVKNDGQIIEGTKEKAQASIDVLNKSKKVWLKHYSKANVGQIVRNRANEDFLNTHQEHMGKEVEESRAELQKAIDRLYPVNKRKPVKNKAGEKTDLNYTVEGIISNPFKGEQNQDAKKAQEEIIKAIKNTVQYKEDWVLSNEVLDGVNEELSINYKNYSQMLEDRHEQAYITRLYEKTKVRKADFKNRSENVETPQNDDPVVAGNTYKSKNGAHYVVDKSGEDGVVIRKVGEKVGAKISWNDFGEKFMTDGLTTSIKNKEDVSNNQKESGAKANNEENTSKARKEQESKIKKSVKAKKIYAEKKKNKKLQEIGDKYANKNKSRKNKKDKQVEMDAVKQEYDNRLEELREELVDKLTATQANPTIKTDTEIIADSPTTFTHKVSDIQPSSGKVDSSSGSNKSNDVLSLAWLSSNNPDYTKDSVENDNITEYLEGRNNSIAGTTIRFSVEGEYDLSTEEGIEKVVANGKIRATLIDGNGNAIENKGTTIAVHVHLPEFTSNSATLDEQELYINQINPIRDSIVRSIAKGNEVYSKIDSTSIGNISTDKDYNKALTDVITVKNNDTSGIALLAKYSDGVLYEEFNKRAEGIQGGHKEGSPVGTIFVGVPGLNGKIFPLRLRVRNVSDKEANLVAKIYQGIYTKAFNKSDKITSGEDAIVDLMTFIEGDQALMDMVQAIADREGYTSIDEVSIQELMGDLVYEGGENAKNIKFPLHMSNGLVNFGESKIKVSELAEGKQGLKDFVKWMTENKIRNINMGKINNSKYKKHLITQKVLTTNAVSDGETVKFIQPTIKMSSEITSNPAGKATSIEKVQADTSTDKKEASSVQVEVESKLKDLTQRRKETELNDRGYTYLGKLYKRVSSYIKGDFNYSSRASVTNVKNSLPVGNFVDEVARLVFVNSDVTYEEFSKDMEGVSNEKKRGWDYIGTEGHFNEVRDAALEIKNQLKSKHGEDAIFYTDEVFVNSDFSDDKTEGFAGVGGVADMVVIQKDGASHVYDFKNKIAPNGKSAKDKIKNSWDGDKSNIDGWADQQSAYKKLLKINGVEVDTINAIVFPSMYERDDFSGQHTNEDEVDNFNPSPRAKEGKPLVKEPFIQSLKYDNEVIPNPSKAKPKATKPEIVLDDEGNVLTPGAHHESILVKALKDAAEANRAEQAEADKAGEVKLDRFDEAHAKILAAVDNKEVVKERLDQGDFKKLHEGYTMRREDNYVNFQKAISIYIENVSEC
jgi:hypothetical protein